MYSSGRHARSARIAYVSSSSVLYRDADQLDLTEKSPPPPDVEQISSYRGPASR